MAKMRDIVEQAKKRRARLLMEFKASKMTIVDFAERMEMQSVRMGQLLKKAKDEKTDT